MIRTFFIVITLLTALTSWSYASVDVPTNKYSYNQKILLKRYDKYLDLIYEAHMKTELPMDELAAFIKIESAFDKNAVNKKYHASGLLQHLPRTWRIYKKQYHKQMGINKNASVFNARASVLIGAAALANERKNMAKATNRHPNDITTGDLYLSHAYGFNRAVKIINAPSNTKINKFVKINYKSGMVFHKDNRVMTVVEFRQGVNQKLSREKSLFIPKTKKYLLAKNTR